MYKVEHIIFKQNDEYSSTSKDIAADTVENTIKYVVMGISKKDYLDSYEKEYINKYLNHIRQAIINGRISFNKFEDYYNTFKKLLCNGLLKDYELFSGNSWLNFADILYNADVLVVNADDNKKLDTYKANLANLVASKIREELEQNGINLLEKFKEIDFYLNIKGDEYYHEYYHRFYFDTFLKFFKLWDLAIKAKFDDSICLEWAQTLINADVITTVHEDKEFNYYKELLTDYIERLKPQKNNSSKK